MGVPERERERGGGGRGGERRKERERQRESERERERGGGRGATWLVVHARGLNERLSVDAGLYSCGCVAWLYYGQGLL